MILFFRPLLAIFPSFTLLIPAYDPVFGNLIHSTFTSIPSLGTTVAPSPNNYFLAKGDIAPFPKISCLTRDKEETQKLQTCPEICATLGVHPPK